MKKMLFIILAILFIAGIAEAASIPLAVSPKDFPEVWTTTVYNNSGSALTSGTVVVWDFANSTGSYADLCNWVTTTTNLDDVWTAGVVASDSIAAAGEGAIIIRGPTNVRVSQTLTVNDLVGSYSTAGQCAEVTAVAGDEAWLGVAINAYTNLAGNIESVTPIYVNPTLAFDD